MITIVQGTTKKPVSAQRLADFFANHTTGYEGLLYIGYPIIGTAEGRDRVGDRVGLDIWVFPKKGKGQRARGRS